MTGCKIKKNNSKSFFDKDAYINNFLTLVLASDKLYYLSKTDKFQTQLMRSAQLFERGDGVKVEVKKRETCQIRSKRREGNREFWKASRFQMKKKRESYSG